MESCMMAVYTMYLEIAGKFWNMVLEKDGENQIDQSCEKWSIT
jgi:hypothetical protein